MDSSTLGLLVPHPFPEFAQVHVRCIGDAFQSSHLLMPSSLSALNHPQHRTFLMSHLLASDDQNTGPSTSAWSFE